ncbi:NADH-quinone oxidoreductase subunit K [Pyrobaculum neutrophilum]|uniref:NADH-quinone oxidoreductase subunit K n=1 Tax=Pyrobaculum neutrophilum TaxID=70771 RepID=UPI0011E578C8|nr:NADH-quinone oxidoreductase subunit K [Pyrobaculum neutrophilum]
MTVATAVGLVLILLGLYGIAVTRNLVRILISLELATVGAFAALAPVAVKDPASALYGVLFLVMASVSEAAILAALIYRNYSLTKDTDVSSITSGREV